MYDQELKQRTIEMAISGQKPIAQVARDLDIKANILYTWIDKFKLANPNELPKQEYSKPVSLEAKNRRLHRELTQAKKNVELLKKAAVYFAAHSQ